MRSAARYLIALVAGLVLSFIFTEAIPFLALGEGAIETDFGTAVILAVAGLLPALAVGWIVLRGGLPAILVALVAGVATPTVYLLGLIDRPQGRNSSGQRFWSQRWPQRRWEPLKLPACAIAESETVALATRQAKASTVGASVEQDAGHRLGFSLQLYAVGDHGVLARPEVQDPAELTQRR